MWNPLSSTVTGPQAIPASHSKLYKIGLRSAFDTPVCGLFKSRGSFKSKPVFSWAAGRLLMRFKKIIMIVIAVIHEMHASQGYVRVEQV